MIIDGDFPAPIVSVYFHPETIIGVYVQHFVPITGAGVLLDRVGETVTDKLNEIIGDKTA